ncbi:MAG: twin-arginine translocase TatA/TatE family subunit [Frateuria sp.]|uniref:twin-arginine translocase TatA/TatE family subunit n=1 Tax=Frateuria sp. TaxID=2211372 RepID=UPI001858F711|nr:twin-arginine translocase TatA/TatE family subunit [Frateuria sp.]NUO72876.1 twin-arginine translocase TatA/TatE family subunit [Frateuria sp.]NUR23135.1 twin-arginine translocase TatA/TatE family subunit [Frateuria sp.]
MGLDSFWHWIILLVVVLVIFGTSKLSKIGPDLGNAVRGFKKAMQGDDEEEEAKRKAQEQLRADPPASESTASKARDSSETK